MSWLGGGQALSVGAEAPDFELLDVHGQPICLADCLMNGWVVLFFYPKDASLVCTRQVCLFRDSYSDFKKLGVTVLGVSGDSEASHEGFSRRWALPYPLLSDADGTLQKAYGVSRLLGFMAERITFVISPDQRIRFVYSNFFSAASHVEQALAFVRQQSTGKAGDTGLR